MPSPRSPSPIAPTPAAPSPRCSSAAAPGSRAASTPPGLVTHIDAAGNLIGHRAGTRARARHHHARLALRHRARWRPLRRRRRRHRRARGRRARSSERSSRHDLEVVDFLAEEVSIFGVSCIGSRGMAGVRPAEWLDRAGRRPHPARRHRRGRRRSRRRARSAATSAPSSNSTSSRARCCQAEKLDIGVVTAIAGITRIEIIVEGRADHAGTTPMGHAARMRWPPPSRLVLAIEQLGQLHGRGRVPFRRHRRRILDRAQRRQRRPVARAAADRCPRRAPRQTWSAFIAELAVIIAGVAAATGVAIQPPLTISDNSPTPLRPRCA